MRAWSGKWIGGGLVAGALLFNAGGARADGPSPEQCATASDDAQPLRRGGNLRAAKQKLLVCVNRACPAMVRDECASELNDLARSIPTVVFDVRDAAGHEATDVKVTVDGAALADRLDGTALEVDPGKHRFVFAPSGGPPVEKELVIREGEKDRAERVLLAPASPAPIRASGSSRWATVGAFAVGGAGIVVGSVFGVIALNDASGLKGERGCPASCPAAAQSQIDTLHGHQWAADVALGVGVVGVVAGAVLLLTSHPADTPPRAALHVGAGGLEVTF